MKNWKGIRNKWYTNEGRNQSIKREFWWSKQKQEQRTKNKLFIKYIHHVERKE